MATRRASRSNSGQQDRSSGGWWQANDEDVGPQLVSIVERLREDVGRVRLDRSIVQIAAYYGCPVEQVSHGMLHGVQPSDRQTNGMFGGSPVNVLRRCVDTATARIYAVQRPKAQVTTSGADYRTRIAARQQSKFLAAHAYMPQDGWSDGWQLAQQIGRDALIFGTGIQKVYPDLARKRICRERKRIWNVFVDPQDGENRDPRSIFELHRYDRHRLMAMFPESREAIERAQSFDPSFGRWRLSASYADQVSVFEGFRLPDSTEQPGRHVIAVSAGRGKTVLLDEPWASEQFPYSFIRFREPLDGFWGTSLVDELIASQEQLDMLHLDMSNNVDALSRGYALKEEDSLDNDDALVSSAGLKVIEYKKGHPPPAIVMPAPFSPATFQWYQLVKSAPNENSGISEFTAQGVRQPGFESGVAQRTMNDIQNTLFMPQSRDFERFFADTARIEIDCANRLVDAGVDIEAVLPSEGFLGAIDWRTIRFPGDQYKVQIQVSNALEDSIAGRKQRLVELSQGGVLDPVATERALDSQALDVEQAVSGVTAQINFYERVIAAYQHWDAEKDAESEIRVSPDPLLDVSLARAQFTMAYAEMLELDAPSDNLWLFRDFIEQCDEILNPKPPEATKPGAGAMASPGAPSLPPGTPMPPGPPGPPPTGPMPPPGGPPGPPMN